MAFLEFYILVCGCYGCSLGILGETRETPAAQLTRLHSRCLGFSAGLGKAGHARHTQYTQYIEYLV
jgi:hypothetical protein